MSRTTRSGSALYFGTAIGVSLLCVGVTLVASQLPRSPAVFAMLRSLDLAWENDLGAWWSGMLLLLAALHAADRAAHLRPEQSRVARGWAALAATLLVLSFDEIASLHERIGLHFGHWLGFRFGDWLALLPLALVLGALGSITLYELWRHADHRRHAWWIGAAFAIFGLVAAQEFLEWHSDWWGQHGDLRAGLEEGSELLAMLILLRRTAGDARGPWILGGLLQRVRGPLLALGLAAAPLLGWLAAVLTDHHRGSPAAWFASAAFLCAAIALAAPPASARLQILGWPRLLASGLCVALSAGAEAFNPALRPGASAKLLLGATLAVCVLGAVSAAPARRGALAVPAAGVLLLLSPVWLGASLAVVVAAQVAVAALILYASQGLTEAAWEPHTPRHAEDLARMTG